MASDIVLKTENLTRDFVDGKTTKSVLKGVSLTLESGTVTALVGRSGSGKSTLLHLLGLLDQPTSGEVFIDGTPAGTLSETDRSWIRNKNIGFVFQHYFLLPEFSVLENVIIPAQIASSPAQWLADKSRHHERAMSLLRQVDLPGFENQRTAGLSGGERQRVGLARAMILQPRILLCDEPTGNLDPDTAGHIMNLIFDASKNGAAVLVVTHDSAIASRADHTLRLEKGSLESQRG